MKKYLLFDLDGTLTDPKTGITSCVQYALQAFGVEEPDADKLEVFIGPPLKESFMSFYGFSDEQADLAVEKYRERFGKEGLFENEMYQGVPLMLRQLKECGMHLAVASSKPTVYVERILEHFHIKEYFEVIVGSELDGRRTNKDEVIREALRQLFRGKEAETDKVYMVGDRKFDVEGARKLQVECVAVAYGYGSLQELKEAHADYIVQSVEELSEFLMREKQEPKAKGFFQVMWPFLFPVLLFLIVRQLAANVLTVLIAGLLQNTSGGSLEGILVYDETGTVASLTGNAAMIVSAICFIAAALSIHRQAFQLIRRTKEDMFLAHLKQEPPKAYLLMGIAVLGAAIGLNLLLELLGLTSLSDSYLAVRDAQYSAAFPVGLICLGLISPACEELLFRGILYNLLRRRMKLQGAMLFSALFFGIYHMNYVQGVYGFLMGLLMVYAYEYFGSFKLPLGVHILANCIVYILSYTSPVGTALFSWPACICFLVLAVLSLMVLERFKRYRKG